MTSVTCEGCGASFDAARCSKRFCGSDKGRTGCAYTRVLETKRLRGKTWYQENKVAISARHNAWRVAHPDKMYEYHCKWKSHTSGYDKQWYWKNHEHIKAHKAAYNRERRAADPVFRLRQSYRARFAAYAILRRYTGQKMKLLGCSPEELKAHLEGLFHPGMSWENRGLWHIDHVRPLASFDLSNDEHVKEAFHYTNLQPLWAHDNLVKGAKVL